MVSCCVNQSHSSSPIAVATGGRTPVRQTMTLSCLCFASWFLDAQCTFPLSVSVPNPLLATARECVSLTMSSPHLAPPPATIFQLRDPRECRWGTYFSAAALPTHTPPPSASSMLSARLQIPVATPTTPSPQAHWPPPSPFPAVLIALTLVPAKEGTLRPAPMAKTRRGAANLQPSSSAPAPAFPPDPSLTIMPSLFAAAFHPSIAWPSPDHWVRRTGISALSFLFVPCLSRGDWVAPRVSCADSTRHKPR